MLHIALFKIDASICHNTWLILPSDGFFLKTKGKNYFSISFPSTNAKIAA